MSTTATRFLKSTGWIVALLVLVAGGLFYWSSINFQNAASLAERGVIGQATVLQSFSRRERVQSGETTRYQTRYYVRFRFTPQGGEPITRRERVNKAFQEATPEGAQIPITYLPSDPSVHEIEPGETRSGGWAVLAIGAAVLGIGGFIGWAGWRNAAREVALIERGQAAEAKIDSVKSLPKNRAQLVYWFADAQGIQTRGVSKTKRANAFDGFHPGQTIRILYDPTDPKTNAWDQDLGAEARG